MYRFLWRPRWIASHVAVLALVAAMVAAMLWQLERLDEKKELNALIEARADVVPARLDDALRDAGVDRPSRSDAVDYRAVEVTGTYLAPDEFTVPSKTLDGAPGRLVVTPLEWSSDRPPVLVLRGFIPQSIDDTTAPIDGVEPPKGEVVVRGWLRRTQVPEGLQRKNARLGDDSFARIDIDRIEAARGTEFAPAYLQLAEQSPPSDAPLLSPYPLPERDEGPHFSYAVQWGTFTLIALVGYPLVLRRVARGGGRRGVRRDDVPLDDPPDLPAPASARGAR